MQQSQSYYGAYGLLRLVLRDGRYVYTRTLRDMYVSILSDTIRTGSSSAVSNIEIDGVSFLHLRLRNAHAIARA